ncbi:hypothetical protein MUK42_33223 [Musa troglodytarum]|uniref:Uncharacterized protein n=1 Tax=Musa troglodytarum TaxID=320322 RepID=A0A9E7F7Q2_9LILI|nr:hypothetical protein MUK42_33223 [Musa troglodytarum]
MEGLVKGLTEVALDAVAGDDVDDARRSHSPSREEGSKSTWVQVVSSGHEEEAEAEPEAGGLNRWRSRKEENDNEGNEGGCETVGSGKRHQQHRQRRRPKKVLSVRMVFDSVVPFSFLQLFLGLLLWVLW